MKKYIFGGIAVLSFLFSALPAGAAGIPVIASVNGKGGGFVAGDSSNEIHGQNLAGITSAYFAPLASAGPTIFLGITSRDDSFANLTVPSSTPSGTYYLKVANAYGTSNGFQVSVSSPLQQPSIILTSPTSDQKVKRNTLLSWTWTSTGPISSVDILLVNAGPNGQDLAFAKNYPKSGSFQWAAGFSNSEWNYSLPNGTYKIAVCPAGREVGPLCGTFSIALYGDTPVLGITYPAGGETFQSGGPITVSFTGVKQGEKYDIGIELNTKGGGNVINLGTVIGTATDQMKNNFTIPAGTPAGTYNAQVTQTTNDGPCLNACASAWSQPFAIAGAASLSTITVASIFPGQNVIVGQPLTIRWTDSREKGFPPQYLLGFIGNNDKGAIGTAALSSCSSGSCSLTWTVEPTNALIAYISICDIANDPTRIACGQSGKFPVGPVYSGPIPAPIISSIAPSNGPAGTRVILSGIGLLSSTGVIFDGIKVDASGSGSGDDVSSPGQLSFTVPQVSTGTGDYVVVAENAYGISNRVSFTLTDSTPPPAVPPVTPPVTPPSPPPTTPPIVPSGSFAVSCSAVPPDANPDGTPGSYKIGEGLQFNAVVNPSTDPVSGLPAYSYQWQDQAPRPTNYNYVIYTSAGKKTMRVKVTDPALKGKARTVTAICSVTIAKAAKPVPAKRGAPFTLSCSADQPAVSLPSKASDRQPVTITFTATPSVPGSYSYAWTGAGVSGDASSGTATGSWKNPGTHAARVKATDLATGKSKTASCFSKFTVASRGSAAVFDAVQSYWDSLWQ